MTLQPWKKKLEGFEAKVFEDEVRGYRSEPQMRRPATALPTLVVQHSFRPANGEIGIDFLREACSVRDPGNRDRNATVVSGPKVTVNMGRLRLAAFKKAHSVIE